MLRASPGLPHHQQMRTCAAATARAAWTSARWARPLGANRASAASTAAVGAPCSSQHSLPSARRMSGKAHAASGAGAEAPAGPPSHTNRLATEKSPYLLQHAHNPVDWYAWGPEALEKAKREDKPIFLSVGYATCHWCHVMERESFEDEETAQLMNTHFINIKVDREERPDVDRIYMSYVQAISGRGGWPMSVWLTPDLEPLYGGTYYPKADMVQGGEVVMPSFRTVLRRLAQLWGSQREDLKAKGTSVMSQLLQHLEPSPLSDGATSPARLSQLGAKAVAGCMQQLGQRFDEQLGGFGGAPKFPRPSEIQALLRAHLWHKAKGNAEEAERALHMAVFTLDKMAAGGMYDHVGGGFHRYSVDELWHVPHFEKMLYDNPQLALAYLGALQVTGDARHGWVARGVLDYLRRDMTAPGGGIYSAEDADSLNPEEGRKTEGWFYLWTKQEVEAVLGPQRAGLFCSAYTIRERGNCDMSRMSDPHNEFVGRNVPILLTPLDEQAAKLGLRPVEFNAALGAARKALHEARAKRPPPGLDDKIVTAWNGLAIAAFATASRALALEQPPAGPCFPVDGCPREEYLAAAQRCAAFLRDQLWDANSHELRRAYREGPSPVPGFADDYSYLIHGLLDLYEAGGGLEWLRWAEELHARMDALFWDEVGGGYFSTTTADPSIKIRIKDEYDGAEPSASSYAASNLYRLAALLAGSTTGSTTSGAGGVAGGGGSTAGGGATATAGSDASEEYRSRADRTLAAFEERLGDVPLALPQLVCAAHLRLASPLRQVIVGCGPSGPGMTSGPAQALLDAVHSVYAPDKAVLLMDLSDAASTSFWRVRNPGAVAMVEAHFTAQPDGAPTAFVCQHFTCQAPTTDPAKVRELLAPATGASGPTLKPATGLPGL